MSTTIIVPDYTDKDLKGQSDFVLKCHLHDAEKVSRQLMEGLMANGDRIEQIKAEVKRRKEETK